MSSLNLLPEYLASTVALVTAYAESFDPIGALYAMLAGTYGSAAIAASSNDHRALVRCYLASAVLHELIGVAHHMSF